jgi:3-oxoacid CoA-transferase
VSTSTQASKIYASAEEAIADIPSGASIAIGGFGHVRNRAHDLLVALTARPDVNNLTLIANSFPHQPLAEAKKVSKFIGAFGSIIARPPTPSELQIGTGEIEYEAVPQGIMTERLRAGAAGIPAFYSPVGVGTVVADGKERRSFDGRDYIMETALRPDYAFIRAMKADELGNLWGTGSTLNFHPTMAAAAKITIAEVDEIVPIGAIEPEDVKIPSIYVDRLVLHDSSQDTDVVEAFRQSRVRAARPVKEVGLTQDLMALRIARMFEPGQFVNLGVGAPTLVANFIEPEMGVMLHAENGLIGYGPNPREGEELWYLYNAGVEPVTAMAGASFFTSLEAFTMARGGHLDAVVLGGLQVAPNGDLANWWVPTRAAGGMGGAMDLAVDVPMLVVMMDHVTREGEPKIVNKCSYPLTAAGCVTRIVTDLAYIDVTPDGLVLREVAPGVTPEYVQARTEPPLRVADDCHEMEF